MSKGKSKPPVVITTIIWLLLNFLVFLTPLIFSLNTKETFEFPKMIFVYVVGATIIFLFLLKNIWWKSDKLNISNYWVLAFVGSYGLATLTSSHVYTSVWGYYSRFNGGLISVLIFAGIYIVAVTLFDKEKLRELLLTSALSSLPVSIHAVYQYLEFTTKGLETRVYSTLGQPNWLAAFLVMILPIGIGFLLRERSGKAVFWFVTSFFAFAGAWVTYSVSGLIGLTGVVSSLLWINKQLVKSNVKKVLLLGIMCLMFSLATPGIIGEKLEDTFKDFKKFVSLEIKIASAAETYNVSDSGSIRKGLWKGTLAIIFAEPKNFIVGIGPETFPYVFQKYRPSELNYTSEWEFILNKPHNYYLEVWVQLGVIGLIAYLGLVFKTLRFKDGLVVPMLIGFYLTNIFGWPTVTTTLIFWVLMAIIDTKVRTS